MSDTNIIKFSGFTFSKSDFEERFKVDLTDIEWNLICNSANEEWVDRIAELKNIAFKCIKKSMNDVGYNLKLDGKEITFKKSEN